MSIRVIVITIVVVLGVAFLLPSNPYTDVITKPVSNIVKKARSYFTDELDIPLPSEETAVYKWQDKDGKWQFSNTKPPKEIESTVKIYKNDENIVPATEIEKK